MAVTIKCPDCGRTKQSDDGEPETCPECEGTMTAPAKKKYQAKSTSLEDEERAKKKSKARGDDDEKPKPRKRKPRAKGEEAPRDGAAAESLGIDPGFGDEELMAQVEEELDGGEVLHWAGRMCPELATAQNTLLRVVGFVIAAVGLLAVGLVLALAPGAVKVAAIVPLLFVAIGLAVALVLPVLSAKAAARSWYAVTSERAVVYTASPWGSSGGKTETYEPKDLRRMRVKPARSPKGAGDLVFKTTVVRVIRTKKDGSSTQEDTDIHHGFLRIENVGEVETLIRNVLLGGARDEDDQDDE